MNTLKVEPVSPAQTAMTVGAVTAALMLVAISIGWAIVGWLVFIAGIFWGMKRFKNECGSVITYFRAWNAGVQTAFFSSVILAFTVYVSAKLDPSLIVAMLEATEQQLLTMEIPSILVETAMQQWREILSPVVFAILIIFMYSITGCFISILCAFFVRNAKHSELVDF